MAETERRMRIGVLISGSGTNLQAIIDAAADGRLDADVAVVVANHEEAFGLERARKAGIPAVWVDRTAYSTFAAYNEAIRDALLGHEVDLVAMAGYMRLLGTEVLDAFPDKVVNIHPALLPAFAGPSGIRDAFEYGVKVTGVTVHFANEHFDEGPIIAQEAVEVLDDDTPASLEARIHEVEHRLYPHALQLFAEGRVTLDGRIVRIVPMRMDA
ncbi:MAG: phosphoribosylglycinamide formyltransferase [Actinomycetota bacterium]|jgi:phosphoribosylglycinamide formyltransferase-1|nr:phosphoribosylglycinamide formyltransferase [Actinomycetota bacterium]MDZ4181031.1 phosphoribosylglycinamide formyltransferase [Coriobacteriia bacterium]